MVILLEEAFPAVIVLEQELCWSRYVHETQYEMRQERWKGLRLRSRRAHAAGALPFRIDFNRFLNLGHLLVHIKRIKFFD